MANGDDREVEIRAGSIFAVEVRARMGCWSGVPARHIDSAKIAVRSLSSNRFGCISIISQKIRAVLEKMLPDISVNSVMIDFYLWDYAKANSAKMDHLPIHHTRSIFY